LVFAWILDFIFSGIGHNFHINNVKIFIFIGI
jgi:hypothetical protein